jgi:hypothetical protein
MSKSWTVFEAVPWSAVVVGRATTKAGANRIADRILRQECDEYGNAISTLYVLDSEGEGSADWSAMQRVDAAVEQAQENAYQDNEARRIGLI